MRGQFRGRYARLWPGAIAKCSTSHTHGDGHGARCQRSLATATTSLALGRLFTAFGHASNGLRAGGKCPGGPQAEQHTTGWPPRADRRPRDASQGAARLGNSPGPHR
jgi:hypothetical protein